MTQKLRCAAGMPGPAAPVLASLALALVAVLMSPTAASAHVPALEAGDGETVIGGPEVSRAVYGYLDSDEDRDVYVFSVDEQTERTVGVIVPAYPEHAGFRPSLGLERGGETVAELDDPGLGEREGEWEPFSLTTFWTGAEGEIAFESGGEYALAVERGTGTEGSGRYVLVFGGPEEFAGEDVLSTFRDLPVIWFGAYGGAPFRWNWWALLPLSCVALLLAGGAFGITRLIRRRPAR